MTDRLQPDSLDAVAIIGMAGRFPGALSVDEFWQNIDRGVEAITFFSDGELIAAGIDQQLLTSENYVKASAVIDEVEMFDAAFFGYSPREAALMDPQQRLFLEVAWQTLEHAGYDPNRFRGQIGLFAGASRNTYLLYNLCAGNVDRARDIQTILANNSDFLTTRASYKLNLRGPSVVVQTACSTSLVAVHQACQSLLAFESDMALAGGVSINVPLTAGYTFVEDGIYSPDGHCRAFDRDAGGTVGGNGVAIVLLKRLVDAQADGDFIHAVIRGTAVNNDGSDKIGFTAPGINGQADVIAAAQSIAGTDPATITYVETHGTGTRLGDPIEVAALNKAFRGGTDKRGYCAIGSLKTNIGHLDAAAGTAGLIKTVMALRHQTLPPSLNYEQANPEIDFDDSPFFVNTRSRPWRTDGFPRRAGVSSFGMGGTNAHVVLEEAPDAQQSSPGRPTQLLLLSAKTGPALDSATNQLAAHLPQNLQKSLPDVAYSLQVGRQRFSHRRAMICHSHDDAVAALQSDHNAKRLSATIDVANRPVAFMFPGQGAQSIGMGSQLYLSESVFRAELDRCLDSLPSELANRLRTILLRTPPGSESTGDFQQTELVQPALFVIEFALAKLWMSWDVVPSAMIGHSIGEYVAACLSGVFSPEDALNLVAFRAHLMQRMPAGSMLSVFLGVQQIGSMLGPDLSVAAVNAPNSCVVSGPDQAITELQRELASQDIACRQLNTSHAFHSAMMDPVMEPFANRLSEIRPAKPQIPFVSNLTGNWLTAHQATDPGYWTRHMRETVRFADGLNCISAVDGKPVLLEVGPGHTLTRLARRQLASAKSSVVVPSMPHLDDSCGENDALMLAVGQLWISGAEIDWEAFHAEQRRHRLPLPTYPFQRQRFWIEPSNSAKEMANQIARRANVDDWFYQQSWKRVDLVMASCQETDRRVNARLLLLCDDQSLSIKLLEALSPGQDIVVVRQGEQFRRIDDRNFTLRADATEDFDQLLDSLERDNRVPQQILHLWCASRSPADSGEQLSIPSGSGAGIYSIVALSQALGRFEKQQFEIIFASTDVYDVIGNEFLDPIRAVAAGMCKVIPQEVPNIRCRHLDYSSIENESIQSIVDGLVSELSHTDGQQIAAYRGRYRWIPSFESIHLPPSKEVPTRLRRGGAYAVIGGLGATGLEIAAYLARVAQANLLLITRSPFPHQPQWDDILKDRDPDDELARRLQKLIWIQSLGSELEIVEADVADEEQLRIAYEEGESRFGGIHGVFHAAGSEKTAKVVQQIDQMFCEEQFRPKVDGLISLQRVIRDKPLDFCFVHSSLSSVLGALGFAAYSAAHHFVDSFVQLQNRTARFPWISVNWDNWVNWKDREMTHGSSETSYYMEAAEALDALQRILDSPGMNQVIVSTGDLEVRMHEWLCPGSSQMDTPQQSVDETTSLHSRPTLSTEYSPAVTKNEKILADIWQPLLGIDKVGIHDNFFEMGGDSVLGIQLVAKAARMGVQISPKQIFECPTVAELAQVAGQRPGIRAEQETVTGEVPLVPIQRWFFECEGVNKRHFNLPMLLEFSRPVDVNTLEISFNKLLTHHDALRLRYEPHATGTRQFLPAHADPVNIDVVNLHGIPPLEGKRLIAERARDAQSHLDLGGPLLRLVFFDHGVDGPSRLLCVVHHLLVDVVSWQILLEDLALVYKQLRNGEPLKLPPKTTSFKSWAEHLCEYARSDAIQRQLKFWSRPDAEYPPDLPRDFTEGLNTEESAERVSLQLSAEETDRLLSGVPREYDTRVDVALVFTLFRAVSNWTGESRVLFDMEGHGREDLFEDVDISRTVGWFTSMYPVLLETKFGDQVDAEIKSIGRQLAAIPQRGFGYGLIRYITNGQSARLDRLPKPELSFLYLGQSGQQCGSLFSVVEEPLGPSAEPSAVRPHLIQIIVSVRKGRLNVEIEYSSNVHGPETMKWLCKDFVDQLRRLMATSASPKNGHLSAEFPAAELPQKDIDALFARLKRTSGQ